MTTLERMSLPALTNREVETLRCLSAGLSNAAIAEALRISENTVKNHVKHIFNKLQVKNRTSAVIKAVQLDIVPAPGGGGGNRQIDRRKGARAAS